VGRRVPGWTGFVAAPVVVFLTMCSYYAYTRHYRTVSGNVAGSPVDSAALQQSTDPQALLGIADYRRSLLLVSGVKHSFRSH